MFKTTTSFILLALPALLLLSCAGPKPPVAHDILAADIDTTVRPGTDFFKYANGTWLKANPIPSSERRWGVGNLVQEEIYQQLTKLNTDAAADANAPGGSNARKIGDFYFAAMDSAHIDSLGTSPLKGEFDRINGISTLQDLLAVIARLHTYGVDALFSPYVDQDEKNSSVYAFHLWQGGIGLPNRDYYFNTDARTVRIRHDYADHIAKMFMLLGSDSSAARHQSAVVMNLETALAGASRKLEDLRDPYRNYNKLALPQLDRLTPSIPWQTVLPLMSVTGIDSVIVGQPEFYREVEKSLRTVSLDDWKSYLRWCLVNRFASSLSTPVADEHFHFYGTILSGVKEQRPRWKRVLDAEQRAMGFMLGQLYVQHYISPSMKQRYEKVVDNIFAAYAERIKNLDWMSETTKQKALAKLSAVAKKVCYPEKWRDYSALQIDRTSYCGNEMRASEWNYNYYIEKLGKPVDRSEWMMTPQTYNAYYNPSNNEIVLPAAQFLIPGLPDSLADDALIYGYAGASTIGHEVTHGFDDEGRQFDARGNLRDWWTKEDEKRFNERAKLMIKQFDDYVVLDSLHINGRACLGENIADLGGVLIGYDAFKKTHEGQSDTLIAGLTPDQRFFLAYAYSWLGHTRDATLAMQVMSDVHSPAFLRVNGPLSDIPAFYKAFNIQQGDPMWRPDSLRVKIW
ncbi:MAG: M13 family metallopeptidase [Bacteroidota bacterium]